MQEGNTIKVLVSGSLGMRDTSFGRRNPIPSCGSMAFVSDNFNENLQLNMRYLHIIGSWLWKDTDLVCIISGAFI